MTKPMVNGQADSDFIHAQMFNTKTVIMRKMSEFERRESLASEP